jgi:hypothetical protein
MHDFSYRAAPPQTTRGAPRVELEVLRDHKGYSGRLFKAGSKIKRTAGVARRLIREGKARLFGPHNMADPRDPLVVEERQGKFPWLKTMTKADLRSMCEENGIEYDGRWTKARLIEAIEEHG